MSEQQQPWTFEFDPPIERVPAELAQERFQRLERLVCLRDAHDDELNEEGRRLLQRAIFTTYLDCRELGMVEIVDAIVRPPKSSLHHL